MFAKIDKMSSSTQEFRNNILLAKYAACCRLREECRSVLREVCVWQITLGLLSAIAGLLTVLMAAVQPALPLVLGTDIWTGLLGICSGSFAHRIVLNGVSCKTMSRANRYLMMAFGLCAVLCFSLCVLSVGLASYATYLCQATDLSPSLADVCQPRRGANHAMAIVDIVVGILQCTVNLYAFWVFAKFRYSFGCSTKVDHVGSAFPKKPRPISECHAFGCQFPSSGIYTTWRPSLPPLPPPQRFYV